MQLQKNTPLAPYSTFKIGGPAKVLISVSTVDELKEALQYCRDHDEPYLIVGKGSNTLFSDKGWNGVAIINKIHFCDIEGDVVHAGAGYPFNLLGMQTARKGLSGLEFASGIPGTVGGAVFMNAGANQKETVDALVSVEAISPEGEEKVFLKEDLHFAYRTSSFQSNGHIVTSATFQLEKVEGAKAKQLALLEKRMASQPYKEPSAGCVFRNPKGHSAGSLIEKCGLKGMRIGGAEVSTTHANFIVNRGGASAQDVLTLLKHVKEKVKEEYGIELEQEMRI